MEPCQFQHVTCIQKCSSVFNILCFRVLQRKTIFQTFLGGAMLVGGGVNINALDRGAGSCSSTMLRNAYSNIFQANEREAADLIFSLGSTIIPPQMQPGDHESFFLSQRYLPVWGKLLTVALRLPRLAQKDPKSEAKCTWMMLEVRTRGKIKRQQSPLLTQTTWKLPSCKRLQKYWTLVTQEKLRLLMVGGIRFV